MDYSITIVAGRVAKTPELKQTTTGADVGNFSVATNRTIKKKEGYEKVPEFYNVVCFGKNAINSNQFLTKGQQVIVSGQMQTRSWEDKDTGKKVYRTELVADSIVFGNKAGERAEKSEKPADNGGYDGGDGQFATVPEKTTEKADSGGNTQLNGLDYGPSINPEDIPF